MNTTLALLAKAFKVNTITTNNNQRSSLIPCISQIAQPVQNSGIQIVKNMNGLSVVLEIANQYGNGNVFIAPAEGLLKRKKQGSKALKNGSTKVSKDENCYDHDIFNMLTHEVQYTDLQTELDRTKEKLENCIIKKEKEYAVLWNNWYTKCKECKYDKISYDKAYNDMQQKIERLQAQLGDLKVTSNHDVCVLNYVNDMNSRADNQSANVSKRKNQKKHKENGKKSKELGSKGRFASSKPSKPRTCLRWIPTGRIFAMCGKLTASSKTENKSKKTVCDSGSTSNPSEPSSKGFPISTSLLGRLSRLRKQHTSIYSIVIL
ncbi:hypothetical protein Tco_0570443 [Tanacetum coccineum]